MKQILSDHTVYQLVKTVFDSIEDGAIIAAQDGKFIIWNQAAEALVGLGPSDLPPEQWPSYYGCYETDTVTPMPYTELPLYQALNGQPVTRKEVYIRNDRVPEGKLLTITAKPLFDQNNEIRGGLIIFNDIEQVRRKAKLLAAHFARLEEDYKELYEKAPVGLWRTSIKDGRFLKVNVECATILGFPNVDEALKHHSTEFYDQKVRWNLLGKLREGGEIRDMEINMTTYDGRNIWVLLCARIYEDRGYLEGSLQDITENKRLELELMAYREREVQNLCKLQADVKQKITALENGSISLSKSSLP